MTARIAGLTRPALRRVYLFYECLTSSTCAFRSIRCPMRLVLVLSVVLLAALPTAATSQTAPDFDIYSIGADGRGRAQLTDDPADDMAPALSPDGSTIAFVRSASGLFDLWLMDADGGNQRLLMRIPGRDFASPTWAPNGRLIAFTAFNPGICGPGGRNCAPRTVYVVRPDGTGLHQVTTDQQLGSQFPVWSPDSRRLLVETDWSAYGPPTTLSVVNADGTGQRVLSRRGAPSRPTWAPDGKRFAYQRSDGVWIRDLRTGRERPLDRMSGSPLWARGGASILLERQSWIVVGRSDRRGIRKVARGTSPSWAPSGNRIAFLRGQMYVVRLDGRGLRAITSESGHPAFGYAAGRLTRPVWSPRGNRLYYALAAAGAR